MPAELVLVSCGEESRSVVLWAFGCVVSLEINCTHVLWRKGQGEEGGKERGESVPNSAQICFLISL